MEVIKKYLSEALRANALLDRAYLFLEDGDTKNAFAYFERVLDENAREPFAYLGKLLLNIGAHKVDALVLCDHSYAEDVDFVKALRFSDGELHSALVDMASKRDTLACAYEKACEAEKLASEVEGFVEVYKLFECAGEFADAKAKVQTIKEALSVLMYYSGVGYATIMEKVAVAQARCAEQNAILSKLNTLISTEETMLTTMRGEVSKREFEWKGLGFFKKKRKLELSAEIEEGKRAIGELEKSIAKNKRERTSVSKELGNCQNALSLATIFGIRMEGETLAKGEVAELPELDGVDLILFENKEKPFALLKKTGVLAVVAKNALALYALMQEEAIVKYIVENEECAKAVGASPAFCKTATLYLPILQQCKTLCAFLPVDLRVAIEAKLGDTVTFGYCTEDGRDPDYGIVPMPGTPYVRPGTPVEWFVLKREGNLLTLIPTKPLGMHRFDPTCRQDMTWENSELRAFMQGELFDLLFQGKEAEMVVPMRCKTGNTTVTDKIILPSHAEVNAVYPLLEKNEHYIWTRDKIEIDYYNSSWLVQPSVFSVKYASQWKELVFHPCDLLPVVTIKIPNI